MTIRFPYDVALTGRHFENTTIKLGTSVIVVPYRNPLPVAKAVATVDMAQGYAAVGCTEISHGDGYPDAAAYRRRIEVLAERIIPSVGG